MSFQKGDEAERLKLCQEPHVRVQIPEIQIERCTGHGLSTTTERGARHRKGSVCDSRAGSGISFQECPAHQLYLSALSFHPNVWGLYPYPKSGSKLLSGTFNALLRSKNKVVEVRSPLRVNVGLGHIGKGHICKCQLLGDEVTSPALRTAEFAITNHCHFLRQMPLSPAKPQ